MNKDKPPRFASWLLARASGPAGRANVLGDYEEIYQDLAFEQGLHAARKWYWSQVLKSL